MIGFHRNILFDDTRKVFLKHFVNNSMMNCRISCVQMQPLFLDVSGTALKICGFIEGAFRKGSDLIVFPELILSGYPNFKQFTLENRQQYNRLAIYADGPELEMISEKAEEHGVVVVLGFVERDPNYPEVIYDSSCVIDGDGSIIGTHRKIVSLGAEKMVFKEGDARDIRVFETNVGNVGVGLCFEHLNPLYRKALSLLKKEIHCALWVNSEDIKHIVSCSTRMTAIEGGTYVALVSQVTTRFGNSMMKGQRFLGGSGIIDPWGKFVSGPIFSKEEVLYADIDPEGWRVQMYQSRGVEARDDLLSLNIHREPYNPLKFKK